MHKFLHKHSRELHYNTVWVMVSNPNEPARGPETQHPDAFLWISLMGLELAWVPQHQATEGWHGAPRAQTLPRHFPWQTSCGDKQTPCLSTAAPHRLLATEPKMPEVSTRSPH